MSSTIGTPVNSTPQSFVDGTQPDTSPQLTTPEGIEGQVGPGQESIVEEFAREQEQAAQEDAILGKFKSPQELAKAYAELQRKMGQQSGDKPQEAEQAEPESAPEQAGAYTAEQAAEAYGKEAVESLAEKGVALGEVMAKADRGEDISEHFQTLAETFRVPQSVVEQFVSKAQAAPSSGGDGLSDADSTAILQELGGEKAFNELQAWGRENMSEQERASYNAAVDSGNAEAVRWALAALQARQGLVQQDIEPQLYGGGTPAADRQVFQSQQQVLDAMNKRNDQGQRLYDVDEAYRNKVAMILSSSPEF
jgi:hypothetical protein